MRPKSSPPFPRTTTRRSGTPISIPKADVPAAGRGGRRPGRFDGPASSSGRAGLSDPRQCQPSADGCHRAGRQRQLVSRDFVVLAVCSPPASSRERQMSALEPRAPPRRRREVFAGGRRRGRRTRFDRAGASAHRARGLAGCLSPPGCAPRTDGQALGRSRPSVWSSCPAGSVRDGRYAGGFRGRFADRRCVASAAAAWLGPAACPASCSLTRQSSPVPAQGSGAPASRRSASRRS